MIWLTGESLCRRTGCSQHARSTSATLSTSSAGQAVFSYTGGATIGVDIIASTCVDPVTGDTIDSNPALRFWDLDCNANDVPDTCDIDCAGFGGQCSAYGTCGQRADVNANGIPDECAICGNSSVEPGEDCGDGDACNGDELCDGAGNCQPGLDVGCSHLDNGCFSGICDSPAGTCDTVVSADGDPLRRRRNVHDSRCVYRRNLRRSVSLWKRIRRRVLWRRVRPT